MQLQLSKIQTLEMCFKPLKSPELLTTELPLPANTSAQLHMGQSLFFYDVYGLPLLYIRREQNKCF